MKRKITYLRLIPLFALLFALQPGIYAQVYQHNFGTDAISSHPYTVAPTTMHPDLSGSSWTNSTAGGWVSFAGSSGQAIALNNSSGMPTITLAFNVAPGKTLDITSFNFWRRRSDTGAQTWAMTINGINVGSGTVPTTGAAIGVTPVANPVNGLSGTVTVVLTLGGATGNGTFRLDDFTLNGTINSGCTAPVITSFEPASGPANTMVTITGSGFSAGTTSVKFGGIESAGFTVVSDTEIKALVASAAVTGAVSVTTAACVGTSSAFTVLSSNCPTFLPPADLFISEVYDADSGEGGAIELYNGTASAIDLSQYSITRRGTVDGPVTLTLNLTGILAPGGVHIVRTNTSVCGLSGTPVNLLTAGFNDDDELELLKGTVVIDNVHTPDNTGFSMIRNGNAVVPQANFNAGDWAISNTENCANLTIHNITSSPSDHISAQPLSASVCEGDNVQYTVTLSASATFTYQWKMLDDSGNWVNISDGPNFAGTNTIQLTVIDTPLDFNGAQFYCQATSVGCTLVSNAVQLTVSPLPLAVVIPVQPTCSIATGGLLIMPSVGDGLTYSTDGVTFQSGLAFNGLAPGTYTLTIKSSANCITTFPFTINPAPLTPAVATFTVTQPDCDTPTGTITVNSIVEPGMTFSIDGSNFQSGTTFTGLLPGSYTVTAMTALGCTSQTAAITIDEAPDAPAVADFTVTQPTCTTATGSIAISAPLGATYTYSIDGTNFQASPVFNGLVPGSYTITTQNDGCTSVTAAITIDAAPVLPAVATTTVTQPDCTLATGSIVITAPVGAGLSYSINGVAFQDSPTFANLAPGNYVVTTQTAEGCTSVTASITIDEAPATPAVAAVTLIQPTCEVPSGSITVTAPVGSDLTYSIDGTTFQSSPLFAGLPAGTYTVTTQIAGGCTSVSTGITIDTVPVIPAVATLTAAQPDCTTATGTITVTAPTGTEFAYSLDGITFQASPVFAGVVPGTYTVTTQSADGCSSASASITIDNAPATPDAPVVTVTQPGCATPGGIEVTAPTGSGLSYSINGTTFQVSPTFANVAPGTYTVTVQNGDGCTSVSALVTIDPVPGAPDTAVTTITQPTCATPTGTVVINSPTGTDITYSIDGTNFQASPTFAGLEPGSYTVTTQNAGGCTAAASVIIDPVPSNPAQATVTVTQPTCLAPTGTIVVTAPTGAGLAYSIDGINFQASDTFANLAPGTYTVTTQGAEGCTSLSAAITINPVPGIPDVAATTVTQPNCSGVTTGTIEVTAPTGTDFTYSIDGTNFQASPLFANLAPGSYTVTTNNAGCQSVTATITINPVPTVPAVAATTVTQPTCDAPSGTIEITSPTGNGFTYSIDGTNFQPETTFANLTGGAYIVTVMNAGGCTSTTAIINIDNSPVPAEAQASILHPDCFTDTGRIDVTAPTGSGFSYSIDGVNFQNGTGFINLDPGTYTIIVKNINGCISTTSVTINDVPEAPVSASFTLVQPTCATGAGTLTITEPIGAQYSYSIDGINWQPETVFTDVLPGEYEVYVQSNGGCKSNVMVATLTPPVSDIVITGTQGCEGWSFESSYMLNASVTGADESTDSFVWTNANGENIGSGTAFNATEYTDANRFGIEEYPLEITLTVTTPGGCTANYTFEVDGTYCDIPRGISPNNDGKNDNFDISGMNAGKVSIFNRYGEEIYTKNNYTNEWAGQTNNGDDLPTGTYFYVIEHAGRNRTGWVYVNREQ
ncbi:gliding motility-associated C-terminal domain-containing protein [uncultured Flavobacterium sp.]|uniref:T9SS type B sorting domain-containing protein n=1 Tax=uncultured Flavobacterium sp. TaxID=165435 RepID=UPI0025D0A3BA|nr:gliding motility-associated C-terminal domain-containing protein [uncultured Flavobacterium sp.]